jgi:hypothetical protein
MSCLLLGGNAPNDQSDYHIGQGHPKYPQTYNFEIDLRFGLYGKELYRRGINEVWESLFAHY